MNTPGPTGSDVASVTRRGALKGAVGGVSSLAGFTGATRGTSDPSGSDGASSTNSASGSDAASGADPFGGWLDEATNADATVDHRGTDEVTVTVGWDGDDHASSFDPAAILVDHGTTVIWEWTESDTPHGVRSRAGTFQSRVTADATHVFEHTFDTGGVHQYASPNHADEGMRGAVAVGDVDVDEEALVAPDADAAEPPGSLPGWFDGPHAVAGAVGLAFASPLLFGRAVGFAYGEQSPPDEA